MQPYVAEDATVGWETGVATITVASGVWTFTRTVLESYNADGSVNGAPLNFSAACIVSIDLRGLDVLTSSAAAVAAALGFTPADAPGLANTNNDLATLAFTVASELGAAIGFADGLTDDFANENGIDTANSPNIVYTAGKVTNLTAYTTLPSTVGGAAAVFFADFINNTYSYNGTSYSTFAALLSAAGGSNTGTLSSSGFNTTGSQVAAVPMTAFSGGMVLAVRGNLLKPSTANSSLAQLYASSSSFMQLVLTPASNQAVSDAGYQSAGGTLNGQGVIAGGPSSSTSIAIATNGASPADKTGMTASENAWGAASSTLYIGNQTNGSSEPLGSSYIQQIAVYPVAATDANNEAASTPYVVNKTQAATLQSAAVTLPQGAPANGYIYVEAKLNGAALNSDLTAYLSRDGGTDFAQGTLTTLFAPSTGVSLLKAGPISFSSQASGSSLKYRLPMSANYEIDILSVEVRAA